MIIDTSLSPLENDWLSNIPAKYRRASYLALKDMLNTFTFNNNIERTKVIYAYMDAFVTAINMAHDGGMEDDKEAQKEESNQEGKEESNEATSS
jgi:hypothetical protein